MTSHNISVQSDNDLLRRFWELEEKPRSDTNFSPEEKSVVQETHSHTSEGRFVVPLPKKPHAKPLGESRTQAVSRFLSLERSLHSENKFKKFADVVEEYFELNHAEVVPEADLHKPPQGVCVISTDACCSQGAEFNYQTSRCLRCLS